MSDFTHAMMTSTTPLRTKTTSLGGHCTGRSHPSADRPADLRFRLARRAQGRRPSARRRPHRPRHGQPGSADAAADHRRRSPRRTPIPRRTAIRRFAAPSRFAKPPRASCSARFGVEIDAEQRSDLPERRQGRHRARDHGLRRRDDRLARPRHLLPRSRPSDRTDRREDALPSAACRARLSPRPRRDSRQTCCATRDCWCSTTRTIRRAPSRRSSCSRKPSRSAASTACCSSPISHTAS